MKAVPSAMPLQRCPVVLSVSGPSGQNTISMRTERNDSTCSCTAAFAALDGLVGLVGLVAET
jgi:hypothetical protein